MCPLGDIVPCFRPARGVDAATIAPLVFESGPPGFRYVFSHGTKVPAPDFLAKTLATPPGEFGYSTHYVAELDGRVVAVGSGYSGRTARRFTMPALRHIFGVYSFMQALEVIRRGLAIERVFTAPTRHEYMVSHLCVVPEMRGRGIGEAMVRYLLGRGIAEGCSSAVLDVVEDNPRAEALYARMGFRVTRATPSYLYNATARVPGVRRMVLPLS